MRLSAVLLGLVLSSGLQAKDFDKFRCGNALIEPGMHRNEIMDVCGRSWVPDEIRTEIRIYKKPANIVHFVESLPPTANTYQYWIYRDYGRYETVLFLYDGYLEKIYEGDRQ